MLTDLFCTFDNVFSVSYVLPGKVYLKFKDRFISGEIFQATLVTTIVGELSYILSLYISELFIISTKLLYNNINDFFYTNPFANYIITQLFNITYVDLFVVWLKKFNIFIRSIIVDEIIANNWFSYNNFLLINNPTYYFGVIYPELQAANNKNFNTYFANYVINSYYLLLPYKFIWATHDIFCNAFYTLVFIFYFVLFLYIILTKIATFIGCISNSNATQTNDLVLYESEKEISSIDDILPLIIIFGTTFGIYFYLHVVSYIYVYCNSYIILFIVLPVFFSFVFIVPLLLLIDFGYLFLLYLRGAGNTALLAAELLYDFINLFAYYIRVVIQCARLILMLTAIGSYQELTYYLIIDSIIFIFSDLVILRKIISAKYPFNNVFFKLCVLIAYIMYEIFHAYFVLTIQTIAFFAMVFWLFFYLFTFFTSESFEKYFEKRRILYNNNI